ncbi:MAG TPA: oligoendopeptidase F [bacterium]|nr:oligoendopeptidase F [bacterium]
MHTMEVLFIFTIGLIAGTVAFAQERDRTKIEEKYKWNLTDIYKSDDDWKKSKDQLILDIQKLAPHKGQLGKSAQHLLDGLNTMFDLSKTFTRLYSYASMSSDQDTRDSKYLAMVQEMSQIGSSFSAAASFIEPEILALDRAMVDGFIKQEPKLAIYKFYLNDILRRQAHTGSAAEEKIIADASLMADGAQNIYSIFSNADFPYPEATFSDGKTVKLDQASFGFFRASQNREDRKKTFSTFFGKLNEFRRTYGTQLYAEIKKNIFYKNARKYNSSLESALDANNIPTDVYHNHVKNVNANLNSFHRYLKLRQRILGVDQLHYYDLYAPLLKNVDLKYSVDEAGKHITTSLAPLGKEYVGVIEKALNERWIDMYPTDGKRSGAYSNGSAYDVHPYMLMNYKGKYDDMSTLTHELGHTMQSYLSNKKQPYPTANYPIFVAEVASTFNEALLIEYMLKNIKDDETRLSLLGSYLEGIKGTVFRQTQFAEFELRIHEIAEKGEALTGDRFNEIYMEITRKYYGHDLGVCIVDDDIKIEWAYIPHFYYNFYVYQYATSFTASAALSEKVISGDKTATQAYLNFLSSGGSKYPIELLKDAGVDMLSTQPIELTMKKMNRVMDEMEKILDRMNKKK